MESGGDMSALTEGCVAKILSFTTPRDACRFSILSPLFRSAAESDVVWERFLPPDYRSIISASSNSSRLPLFSKKQLYFTLCDNPILIDDGMKSFSLDKWSGKKCYMLSARSLMIIWGDTPAYWGWHSDSTSRFAEVAELDHVWWFEIGGKIDTSMLSPSTQYAAYLVFKLTSESYGFKSQRVEVVVGLGGGESCMKRVFLHPIRQSAKERGDGWLEIELGEYVCEEGSDGELEMKVLEVKDLGMKSGIIVEGIEMRPKGT